MHCRRQEAKPPVGRVDEVDGFTVADQVATNLMTDARRQGVRTLDSGSGQSAAPQTGA